MGVAGVKNKPQNLGDSKNERAWSRKQREEAKTTLSLEAPTGTSSSASVGLHTTTSQTRCAITRGKRFRKEENSHPGASHRVGGTRSRKSGNKEGYTHYQDEERRENLVAEEEEEGGDRRRDGEVGTWKDWEVGVREELPVLLAMDPDLPKDLEEEDVEGATRVLKIRTSVLTIGRKHHHHHQGYFMIGTVASLAVWP